MSANTAGRVLPFSGRLLEPATARSLRLSRALDLSEDLYLADHLFIHAAGVKPPAACLPVMPMAFSLEMMAETAACLVPGNGLVGFEHVRASQWIDLQDQERLELEARASLPEPAAPAGCKRVLASIRKQDAGSDAISGTALLDRRYRSAAPMRFDADSRLRPFPLSTSRIYEERYLFHGPRLRCMEGIQAISAKTLIGAIRARDGQGLFRSVSEPQLLSPPHLIDAVAQLMVGWFYDKNWWVLPMSIDAIHYYRPTPPRDSVLPVAAQIRNTGRKTVTVDFEVRDEARRIWLQIAGWRFWILRYGRETADFFRLPQAHLLAAPVQAAGQPGAACVLLPEESLTDVNPAWLARVCLHLSEMPLYANLKGRPADQRRWLVARAAAKDAVRLWLSRQSAMGLLHPASFTLVRQADGYAVGPPPGASPPILVKVFETGGGTAAICHPAASSCDLAVQKIMDRFGRVQDREAALCS